MKRRVLFLFGPQIEVAGSGFDVLLRNTGAVLHIQFLKQHFRQFEVVIDQKIVFPPIERLERGAVVIEIGRSPVSRHQRNPMLVLPPLRIVEPHIPHRRPGPVGTLYVHREVHHAARSENLRPVALRTLDKMFPEVDDAIVAQQVCEIFDRPQIGCRQNRHGRSG